MAKHSLSTSLAGMSSPGKGKKLGTPKTSMSIEFGTPAAPAAKPSRPADKTPLLNAPNTYDRNTYTPDMKIYKPQLTKT